MKKSLKKFLSVFLSLVMMLSCMSVMGGVFTFSAKAGDVTVSAHYQYYTPGYWNDESTLYLTNADSGTNANYVIGEGYEVNYLYAYGDYSAGGTIYYNNAYATKYVDYRTNKTIDSLDMYIHFDNSPVISCYPWTRVEYRSEGSDWYINREANEHGVYNYDNTAIKLNGYSKNNLPSSGSVDLWVQSHNIVLGPSSEYIGNSIWWKGHQHYNTIYITFYMHDTTALYNEVYAASTQTAINNGASLYTAASWSAFINAYNNAVARITNTNDQSVIDAAKSDLVNARSALVRIYTVRFTDDANNVLSTQTLVAGTAPTVPAIPAKAPDTVNHYTANGWDSEVTAANADKTYKAVYTVTAHSGMDDFTCDVCHYYDAAGALADAKTKAAAAINEAAGDAPSYGVAAVSQYALVRINNATTIESVNAEKEAALDAIDALVNDKRAAYAEAQEALADAQEALTEAQTALTEKTAALTEANANLADANAALIAAEAQIDTLTADLAEAQTALAAKETALTEANAALTAEQNAKAALETQLTAKENELAALQDTVDADADEIAALEADIADLEAAITEKDGVITEKTNEITALEATVAANETAIAAAQTQIEDLTADLTAAQTQVDSLTAALAEAQTALAAKDAALTEANTNLATANAALITANAQISSLTDDVNEKAAALTTAENNLATANTALAAAEAQINGLTDDLAAANDALAAKEIALAEADEALTAAQTEKTALETQLAAKETALAALQDTVDADADEIAALEADIADLEAAITEKDGVITAKTNEINTLKAGAAAYESAIAEAENEISAKEAEIASLKTRLNKALDDIEALREGIYVEPEDDGTCKYCGKIHQNVLDKFLCMIIRFFDFLVSVFDFSSAT